ncbi:MAG: DEAD/DEAH box helicase [Acidiferrobacteraceae bacterium]
MTINELRKVLSTEDLIEANPFKILHDITSYVNNPETEDVGRELVLRALEKRDSFEGYEGILGSLTREVGLFPYLDYDTLSFKDSLAYELHKPEAMEDTFVLHRAQAEIYRRLVDGENVIVSAPTSFGKSRIIDALIASGKYNNVAVVVPTIALIDETRRRLAAFKERFKVVTQVTQEPSDRNIFVFTAERINAYEKLPKVDFFVIDEFYKIGALAEDETRTVALNQAFYKLHKSGGQFYMLGPNIRHVPDGLENKFRCFFYSTHFATVVSEVIQIFDWTDEIDRLAHLAKGIDDQTLIFCRSPKRVNEVVKALVDREVCGHRVDFDDAVDWISEHFHPDWTFHKALKNGIGMHHGRLPRSLAQFAVRAFNEGRLKFLVCTSTLIEGVNTKAKNVVILDSKIGTTKYDFFTFNNIKGRSGRMFHHFVGRVYIFNAPPQEELPFVDFPLYTQDENAPESLLIQLDLEDLKPKSVDRLSAIYEQDVLPIEVIRKNAGIDPKAQVALAEYLGTLGREQAKGLSWTGIPDYGELANVCELIWDKLLFGRGRSGVRSARQLAYKTNVLMHNRNTRARVEAELEPGQYRAETPDEAVERVLEFDRNWAGFELPRLVMALSRIQEHVFRTRFRVAGNYSFFAARLEALFRNPVAVALEEYGLPIQITDKIEQIVKLSDDLDSALLEMKMLPSEHLNLNDFEAELLCDVQSYL